MMMQAVFALALLVGVGLAVHRRCPLLVRSAIVLAANLALSNVAVAATGRYDPVAWFIVIDTLSALVLLWHPAGRTQAAIGMVYIMQLALHFVQWPGGVAEYEYLSVLTVGGGLQIAFLIWGAVDGDGRKVRDIGAGRSVADVPVADGATRVAQRRQQ
jgi:hypothetical protein